MLEEHLVIYAYNIKFNKNTFFNPIKPVKIRVRKAIKEKDSYPIKIKT
jgi:fructose-specific phosphotransferase system component IIB